MSAALARVIDAIESELRRGWITEEQAREQYTGIWLLALEMNEHRGMLRPSAWARRMTKTEAA